MRIARIFFILILLISHISFAENESEADHASIRDILSQMNYTNTNDATINLIHNSYTQDMVYSVFINNTKLIFRIFDPNKPFEIRQKYYKNSQAAFDLGIAPKMLYAADDYSIIVSEFIEGEHPNTKTFLNHNHLRTYARNLRALHSGPLYEDKSDMFDYLKKFIPRQEREEVKLAIAKFEELKDAMLKGNYPDKPCHNDLHSGNIFVLDDGRILFIDWDTAGMRNPFFELARSSIEFILNEQQEEIFLKEYLGEVTELDRARYYLTKQLFFFSAIAHDAADDKPPSSMLKAIIRVFRVNNFPLDKPEESISWHDVSSHSLKYFLKQSETDRFKRALEVVGSSPSSRGKQS